MKSQSISKIPRVQPRYGDVCLIAEPVILPRAAPSPTALPDSLSRTHQRAYQMIYVPPPPTCKSHRPASTAPAASF